jgi:hypothetical protein
MRCVRTAELKACSRVILKISMGLSFNCVVVCSLHTLLELTIIDSIVVLSKRYHR